MEQKIFRIILTLILSSCVGAPRLPRDAKIWASDNIEQSIVTVLGEDEECLGREVLINDELYCAVPWEEMERSHVCLTTEDQAMIQVYIATLINKCRRWRE